MWKTGAWKSRSHQSNDDAVPVSCSSSNKVASSFVSIPDKTAKLPECRAGDHEGMFVGDRGALAGAILAGPGPD
jgi:hypothetical protein